MARRMSDGQRAYETKRAGKAGHSLDQWLHSKSQQRAPLAAASASVPGRKPGTIAGAFARFMEWAHKPLG